MSEITVTKGLDADQAPEGATATRVVSDDDIVITVSKPGSRAASTANGHAVRGVARAAFRAGVIGGITAVVIVGLLNRRSIAAHLPEPRELTTDRQRRRYARRTLHSMQRSIA